MGLFARQHTDEFALPHDARLNQRVDRLRRGAPIGDSAFDEVYPVYIRRLSLTHWTPIEVIRRVTGLLVSHDGARILDVGSGVGKFCLVGAMISKGRFHGVEQRGNFVELSNEIASLYKVARTTFIHANFKSLDWSAYDAVYLFNPFQENRTPDQRLDDAVPLSRELYLDYVSSVIDKLAHMPHGTRVVTYHGFGGAFPSTYMRKLSEWCYRGPLELWLKTR